MSTQSTAKDGQTITVNYIGTLDDGTQFDSSYDRGEPIAFVIGGGEVLPAFSAAAIGMAPGEKKTIHIDSADGYGARNAEAVQVFPLDAFPEDINLEVGMQIQGEGPNGQFPAIVTGVASNGVILDLNHPLVDQNLNFEIELVEISD